MRFTKKKIISILSEILGEEVLPLVEDLVGKENVSEFDLAKNTNIDIKIVRRTLYILYNYNLVKFNRKKDKEKGWYIYYWTLIPENIGFDYYKRRKQLLERLKQRLEDESKAIFFKCPNSCVRLDFDQSMDFEFHCPECGELISQDDSGKELEVIRKRVEELEKELEELREARKIKKHKKEVKQKEIKERKIVKKKEVKKKVPDQKVVKLKEAKKVKLVKDKLDTNKNIKKSTKKVAKTKEAKQKEIKLKQSVKKKEVKKRVVKKRESKQNKLVKEKLPSNKKISEKPVKEKLKKKETKNKK